MATKKPRQQGSPNARNCVWGPPTFKPTDSPMDVLVKLSRYYGGNPDFVLAGGGNTSMKTEDVLYVKASGFPLGTIEAGGFVALARKNLAELLGTKPEPDAVVREERVKQALLAARIDKENPPLDSARGPEPVEGLRPSVESILHNLFSERFVIHTHPVYANALTCCERGRQLADELFGDEVMWVPYADPGFLLGRAVKQALEEYRRRTHRDCPEAILLQNHGLIVGGNEPGVILKRTERVIGTIRKRIDAVECRNVFGEVKRMEADRARGLIEVIGPSLRALLAEQEHLKVVTFDDSESVLSLVGAEEGEATAGTGPLGPDQIVYCGSFPLWFEPPVGDATERIVSSLGRRISDHARACGCPPKVVLVKNLGMFAAGDDFRSADITRRMYADAIRLMSFAKRLGGIHPMTEEERRFIEGWDVQTYRKKVSMGGPLEGGAAGHVAVVTGAAQGLGLEISRELAAQGAHVVLTDVNTEGVERASREISTRLGKGRTLGLTMDVAESRSIAAAVHEVVRTYGGFDVFISNAGVLRAGPVKTQPEAEFDLVTDVNYRGYFRCVQKASAILRVQHLSRPTYWSDIIQINSKSGLVGSNRNAAYAGSKFGGIGLTQSFALELLDDGIKVNAICPGNFFDGPLWSDPDNGLFVQYLRSGKVPGAKTIQDVRRAYEAKIPMGRGCTTADVMKAVYYLMEQQYETGQAIPVTGGQIMLH